MEKEIKPIETMDLKEKEYTPIKKKEWCNHFDYRKRECEIWNERGSIVVDKYFCNKCPKELSEDEVRKIKERLNKFKQNENSNTNTTK